MELSEVLKFKLLVIAHTISVYSQVAASFSQIVAVFVRKDAYLRTFSFKWTIAIESARIGISLVFARS